MPYVRRSVARKADRATIAPDSDFGNQTNWLSMLRDCPNAENALRPTAFPLAIARTFHGRS